MAHARTPVFQIATFALATLVVLGAGAYGVQLRDGMAVTGLSQSVPWGLYVSQFTFFVGVAASSVVVVAPCKLHDQRRFERLVLVGETVSVIAVVQALLFVMVDLGRPGRLLNVLLFPSPSSLMFWDLLTLGGYLVLCATILSSSLLTRGEPARPWLRGLYLVSIPWACAIHVVTALIYAGLTARPAWMTAILAPRFLATAFASGSALLILISRALERVRLLDDEGEGRDGLAIVMAYATVASLLFGALELFTARYSDLPSLREHGASTSGLVVASWTLAAGGLVILLVPRWRRAPEPILLASAAVLASVLLEKGLSLIPSGFSPAALGGPAAYRPSAVELTVAAGIHAFGVLAFLLAARTLLAPAGSGARARLAAPLDPAATLVASPPNP